MLNVILGVLLVVCMACGNLPSVSTALAAVLAWRALPYATNELATGIILVVGGFAAKRRRARLGD